MIGGCCKTCKFYSPGSHYDCRENVDELVTDKERPNFCEFYCKDPVAAQNFEESKKNKAQEAEKAFDSFFNI